MNENRSALVPNIDKNILEYYKAYPDSMREYDMTPELCLYAAQIKRIALRYKLKVPNANKETY